jgi:DnaK suppressor protein
MKQAELIRTLQKREPVKLAAAADILESVQSISQQDLAWQHSARQWDLLREVNRPLKRIENHSFGACLNCANEISARRLEAVPWTRFCMECQAAAENREAGFAGRHEFFQARAA